MRTTARLSCRRLLSAIRWLALAIAASSVFPPESSWGQLRDTTPTTFYYTTRDGDYYDGRYRDALRSFRQEGRGAIKNGATLSFWIDSICYHTMCGECYYQMGQFPDALDHYNQALKLFLANYDWMIRAQFPDSVRASSVPRQVPWGHSTRNTQPANIPEQVSVAQGDVNAGLNVIRNGGGVATPPVLFPLHAKEIVRCTTLALRRWRELMGPSAPYDPLSSQLVAVLSKRPCPPNNWSEAWIDIELGLAYAAEGNDTQARPLLERGLVVQGEFDHDMTCIALLELGRIAMAAGDLNAAGAYFEEATYSAAFYGDISVLEEAFRFGLISHLLANKPGPYPPLEMAAGWAKVKGLRQLQVSLSLLATENLAVLGQNTAASNLLEITKPLIGNRDMGLGRIGARFNYLSALVRYQEGNVGAGDDLLATTLKFQSAGGSLWMFHVGIADLLVSNGTASEREAMSLYEAVLRDPGTGDWATDPLESLSVLVVPHPLPWEHWFEIALNRKEHETALEIADALRRHRFLTTTKMGGRLLALRWLLEGPQEIFDQRTIQQRQDMLVRFPQYADLSQKAVTLRTTLANLPLAPDDAEQQKAQADALKELGKTCAAQEVLLRQIAVRREPGPIVFPPRLKTKDLMAALPEGHALLSFLGTTSRLHAFLITKDKYAGGSLGSFATSKKQLAALLRQLGNYESNHEIPISQLADEAWKRTARDLFNTLFKGSKITLPGDYEELIVVPDGLLWYVPFEVLQYPEGKQTRSLISKLRIRYAPTTSLAVPDARGRRAGGTTAVVLGRMFPKEDPAMAQDAMEQLSRAIPGTATVPSLLPAPSALYCSLFDRLVVFDDLAATGGGGVYDWSPLPVDRGKPGSSLDQWMLLPWNGPDQVILPGFHSPAENALKKGGTGQEIFLSLCGLMATGSRTVLLSRWRTGGQTSYNLIREFTQELPHTTASEAWQRAVFLVSDETLDPANEPRIEAKAADDPPKADHPFFWSGYLLADTGTPADTSEQAPPREPEQPEKEKQPQADAEKDEGNVEAEKEPEVAEQEPEDAKKQPEKRPPKGKKPKVGKKQVKEAEE